MYYPKNFVFVEGRIEELKFSTGSNGLEYCTFLLDIDHNPKEDVLPEDARKHKAETSSPFFSQTDYKQGVIDGAEWQKEQMMKDAIEDVKVDAMKDIAWKVHCMISKGKSIAEIDHYVCGVCDF